MRGTLGDPPIDYGPVSSENGSFLYEPYREVNDLQKGILHVKNIIEDRDVNSILEKLFHVRRRGTTWKMECYSGFVHFVSCMYVLPVVPNQLSRAGFDSTDTVIVVAACCGIGCLIAGLFANLPFIIAPPTAVSIFYSVFIQQNDISTDTASSCVIACGVSLVLFGYRPLGRLATRLIPQSIQAGTAVGIGLITALAGATEIDLVKTGKYTIVDIGKITPEVIISMCGFIVIAVALFYRVKAAFCIALIVNTIIWWTYKDEWPGEIAANPHVTYASPFQNKDYKIQGLLLFELVFLCLLTLSGLVKSMSDLSHLTREDGTTPRNRWLFIMCGMMTVLSGYFSGPPILISPETAGGIKAGAKTGLSTIVCGVFFCLSTFFAPVVREVPGAATAPLLMAVGVILTQNVKNVDWGDVRAAFPAFCCIFFIPFTYNILFGVAVGYIMFISVGVFTGSFYDDYNYIANFLAQERNSILGRNRMPTMDMTDDNVYLVSDFDFNESGNTFSAASRNTQRSADEALLRSRSPTSSHNSGVGFV